MRAIIYSGLIFLSVAAQSQDTIDVYFDSTLTKVVPENQSEYHFKVYKKGDHWREERIYRGQYLFESFSYRDSALTILDGPYRSYSSRNIILEAGNYENGVKINSWTKYSKGGMLQDSVVYKKGEKWQVFYIDFPNRKMRSHIADSEPLEKVSYLDNGILRSGFVSSRGTYFEIIYDDHGKKLNGVKLEGDKIVKDRTNGEFVWPELKPFFPAGKIGFEDYFERELLVPCRSRFGAVFPCQFSAEVIIDKAGRTREIKVLKSVNTDFDQFVLSALKSMPPWLMVGYKSHKQVLDLSFNN